MIKLNKQKIFPLLFSLVIILMGSAGLYFLQYRDCITGYWGYKSCGNDGLIQAVGLLVIGIIMFMFILFTESKKHIEIKNTTLICPQCETPMTIKEDDNKNKKCNKCVVDMVPLEGFYDNKKEEK